MKGRYTLFVTMLLFATFCSYGQATIDTPVERHKWEVSVNTLPLIKFNTNYFLWVRRNLEISNGSPRALRLRFSPYYNQSRNKGTIIGSGIPALNLFLAPGYEWQQQYGRFATYYGADLIFSYERSEIGVTLGLSPATANTTIDLDRNVGIGSALFFGAKYFLNHRLSVNLETQFQYTYTDVLERRSQNGIVYFERNAFGSQLTYSYLYALTLNYHF